MDVKKIREMLPKEIKDEILSLRKEQLGLRLQLSSGKTINSARLCTVRKDVARMKTILNEKKRELSKEK